MLARGKSTEMDNDDDDDDDDKYVICQVSKHGPPVGPPGHDKIVWLNRVWNAATEEMAVTHPC
jgi:hypothetical protein